jgi:hypothetical protein
LSSSVSIWCVSSATSEKPKVAAPPLTECAQRKMALSSSSSAFSMSRFEQHLLHRFQVLAGLLEEDLVELAQVDACATAGAFVAHVAHGGSSVGRVRVFSG